MSKLGRSSDAGVAARGDECHCSVQEGCSMCQCHLGSNRLILDCTVVAIRVYLWLFDLQKASDSIEDPVLLNRLCRAGINRRL